MKLFLSGHHLEGNSETAPPFSALFSLENLSCERLNGCPSCPVTRTCWSPLVVFSPLMPLIVLSAMDVDHEVNLLVEEIRRLGSKNADGKLSVKFGVLFQDDRCANLFEALVGTLKAAKRRKIVTYTGELLLQGVHDNVDIVLLQD
ncbi:costars family protein ABRACL isoform X1 [Microtus pennsylvanicus]|uniref:costars family protein ABRACL isoform X1 n=2 Tax=Microtus pennsylvanicus TaxID=10058 RepID=UPI003F6D26D9